ncbi:MAG: lytic transglycosylase domain-containing protein [bacterium]|nr:lytic transglycosylase domain-containing protein [bacterium]
MKLLRNITVPVLLFFLLVLLPKTEAYSKVYKRLHPDGTLEFYNKPARARKRTKRVFTSKYNGLIETISKEENVDPYLVKCIVKVESNFNPNAVSVAGAMGLMQLMQATAGMYDVHNPFDPEENLRAGIKHFGSLLRTLKNDVALALAAYHAGLGRVKKRMAVPPIKSTMAYVKKIMYLYKGHTNVAPQVKKLYKRIDKEGTLYLYN